ncbi:MAG: DUF6653 family protein [Pseudomonadota bacterium]
MQTPERQFHQVQQAHHRGHPANSVLGTLRTTGSGKPASARATYAKILAPALLSLAIWSHIWIGTYAAFALTALVLAGLLFLQRRRMVAPRKPSWATAVGFGERIWLNRLHTPIPDKLSARITTLYLVYWLGAVIAYTGGITTSLVLTGTGLAVAYSAQLVCFQKLAALFDQMKDKSPLYQFWSSASDNDNSGKPA